MLKKLYKMLDLVKNDEFSIHNRAELCVMIQEEIQQRKCKIMRAESGQLDPIVSLRDGLTNAREALEEIQKYNRIGNDLDAYLYELTEWALGKQKDKPNPKDYGVGE